MTIYLDNNATAQPTAVVMEAVARVLTTEYGNPSSPHSSGVATRSLIEGARHAIAEWLGGLAVNYVFTSGCTEANNTVLWSAYLSRRDARRIAVSAVEHPSVLQPSDAVEEAGARVSRIPVDRRGIIDFTRLEAALREGVYLVSIQWVNGETGIIQPVDEISRICRKYGALFHTDAAQAIGRLPVDLTQTSIDFLTLSGHKLHALSGVGVVYVRQPSLLRPLIHGGGQEHGIRSGTENWTGIASLEAALAERLANLPEHTTHLERLRDAFEKRLSSRLPWASINGAGTARVCNTSNVLFAGIDGQALVARLDQRGVICSQTSACSSSRPEPSYVLRAIGLSEDDAYSSVRFSVSVLNSLSEIEEAVEVIAGEANALRALCAPADTTPKTLEQETLV